MSHPSKIVLIGAGSLQFGIGTVANILDSEILVGSEIILHDIDEKSLELSYRACKTAIEKRKIDFTVDRTTVREEALRGAQFIINSIEVAPRFELLDLDYHVPHHFGNRQVTGENGGPGGFFHSLRVIPPILDICADIMKFCPTAFLINFSNPMSRICLAIKRKFPNLTFAGLCHEYQHFIPLLPKILGIPLEKMEILGGGLNHMGVLLSVKERKTGKDLYPELRQKGPEFFANFTGYDGFKLTGFILDKFGYVPYTPDSHYGEYIHWAWEQADIHAIRKFWRTYKESLSIQQRKMVRLIKKGKGERVVKPDEENAIPIIEGIVSDSGYIEPSVNISNNGIISNLPNDLVIECPVTIDKNGPKGITLGEYPKGLAALVRTQASVQDVCVEAILQESRDLAIQALLVDPVVDTYWQAEHMLDEILKLQAKYLQIDLS